MHIKLTVRWTFQTNNYRCICFITKIIIGLIVSQFMHSLGYSLILCPYTLDLMTSYKIIFNVTLGLIEIGLPIALSYFGTDMIMRSNV